MTLCIFDHRKVIDTCFTWKNFLFELVKCGLLKKVAFLFFNILNYEALIHLGTLYYYKYSNFVKSKLSHVPI